MWPTHTMTTKHVCIMRKVCWSIHQNICNMLGTQTSNIHACIVSKHQNMKKLLASTINNGTTPLADTGSPARNLTCRSTDGARSWRSLIHSPSPCIYRSSATWNQAPSANPRCELCVPPSIGQWMAPREEILEERGAWEVGQGDSIDKLWKWKCSSERTKGANCFSQ
jgi:hypothetical protein